MGPRRPLPGRSVQLDHALTAGAAHEYILTKRPCRQPGMVRVRRASFGAGWASPSSLVGDSDPWGRTVNEYWDARAIRARVRGSFVAVQCFRNPISGNVEYGTGNGQGEEEEEEMKGEESSR